MTPDGLEANLRADEVAPGYLRPRYADYNFANVPATATAAVGVDLGPTVPGEAVADADGIERVVVVIVDGFGWTQWLRDGPKHRFFRRLIDHGSVGPLSTVYPSETAACLTTFHTGEPPARHGLIGWSVYVEALEAVVEPLPFRTADGEPLGDRVGSPPGERLLFDGESIYPDLRSEGVTPTAIQPVETVGSPYSERALEGASVVGYESPAALATAVRRELETDETPQYVLAYCPAADEAAHHEGTDSPEYRSALACLAAGLEAELVGSIDPSVAAETLLLVTADHGIVDTHPPTNVDLYAIDGVRDRLKRSSDGDVIPPSGGPRNVHLHARSGELDALRALLERELDALVFDRAGAVEAGLFGGVAPSDLFEQRAGDLLVVPNERSVWYGGDSTGLGYVGMHGGLHPDELLVPLASARLADLVD